MTLKLYLWSLRVFSLLFGAALGFIVFYIDIEKYGVAALTGFYASFFLTFSGMFILALTQLRKYFSGGILTSGQLSASFRQGILLAMTAVALLFLQSLRMLAWWDGLLVAAGVLLIELHYLTKR